MMKIDVKIQNRVIEHYSFEKGSVTIGRDPGCDLRIDNPVLSRRHAQITAADGQHFIEDLGSTNGVFLRDQKVAAKTPLRDGDEFKIDKFTFHVKLAEGAAAEPGKKKDFAFDIMGTMQIDASKMQERLKKEAAAPAPAAAAHAPAAPAKPSQAPLWIGIAIGLVAGFIAGWLARGGNAPG